MDLDDIGKDASGRRGHFVLPGKNKNRVRDHPARFMKIKFSGDLDQAGFFKHFVGTHLVHGLERTGSKTDFHEFAKLRNENALVAKVRVNLAFHALGNVLTDTAFFLGLTTAVDLVS